MARLTSEFFVSALLRTMFDAGDFGAVLKKGAPEAGAVFIVFAQRSGPQTLYGPAPQALMLDDETADRTNPDRSFEVLIDGSDREAIDDRLAREQRYDDDIWIVELEGVDLPNSVHIAK